MLVQQLFNAVLPPRLLSAINTDPSASLFLITCGGVHAKPDSRQFISDFVKRLVMQAPKDVHRFNS